VREPGAGFVRRAAGAREIRDAPLERPIIELVGIDLGDRQLLGRHAGKPGHLRHVPDEVHVGVVDSHVLEQPVVSAGTRDGALGLDHPLQLAAGAVVDGDVLRSEPRRSAGDDPGVDEIVAGQQPGVADDAAVRRDRLVAVVRPGGDDAGRIHHHRLVEQEQRAGDRDARDNQRSKDLVRREAGRLHRDHLAVLVEADEGDQGDGKKDRLIMLRGPSAASRAPA
jgi:hypothetical protein